MFVTGTLCEVHISIRGCSTGYFRDQEALAPELLRASAAYYGDAMISIRAAIDTDYSALLEIWRRSVEATHEFLTPADVDAIEQDVATYLPQMSDLRVAEEGGQLIGFIAIENDTVEMLFVDALAQGRGIGSALLASVVTGRESIRVDVNEQNPSGRNFYAAKGFTEIGRSETDGEGRAFPLLHLHLAPAQAYQPQS